MRIGPSLLTGSAIVVVAIAGLWVARRPIAAGAIDRALAARGISARYTIRDIGFRTQRLERISLGDPAHPDLTADWAVVELTPWLFGITVDSVRTSGVRLAGRYNNGVLSFGSLDRLLPKASGGSFVLPAIDVDIQDAQLRLATPQGEVFGRLDGRGGLANGFRGKALVRAASFGESQCRATAPTASVDIAIINRRPALAGPV